MRALVVCDPPPGDDLVGLLAERTAAALRHGGHEVRLIDLAADHFDPVMGRTEWMAYRRHEPLLDERTGAYAEALLRAEVLAFVYRSSWFGLPVRLKGFLERTFVPGVAFTLDPVRQRVRGRLGHVRHLVVVSAQPSRASRPRHAGGPRQLGLGPELGLPALRQLWELRPWQRFGDPGRRTLLRTLRLACPRHCRSTWLALAAADRAGPDEVGAFLARLDRALGARRPACTTAGRLLPPIVVDRLPRGPLP